MRLPASAIVMLPAALWCLGCGGLERGTYGYQGELLGVRYNVTLAGPATLDRDGYREVSQRIQTRLAEVLTATSEELTFSDLTRINQANHDEEVEVSRDMIRILEQALRIAAETRGAFDVTKATLDAAWGLERGKAEGRIPSERELQEVTRKAGWKNLALDKSAGAVRKLHPELRIELDGVAEGYAVDALSAALTEMGWTDHAIQVGEEVLTRGVDRLGRPWKISIQRAPGSGGAIPISGRAIAVSGNDEWFRAEDGSYYPRRMDPRSGRPVENNVLSASVVSEDGTEAKAYSQALAVMAPDEGLEFAEERGLAALILVQEGDDTIEERITSGFERLDSEAGRPGAQVAAALVSPR